MTSSSKIKSNRLLIEGIESARKGLSPVSNPYEYRTQESRTWIEGYELIKPNGETCIENVFTVAFGGPPKLEEIFEYKKGESWGTGTGKYETPIGDWFKPENYIVREDSRFGRQKKGDAGEWNNLWQDHFVHNGVYDVSGTPRIYLPDAESTGDSITHKGLAFVEKYGHENIYIASGYQVVGLFLLAGCPHTWPEKRNKGKVIGNYGRGACAIFKNCPKSLLIVAEDD